MRLSANRSTLPSAIPPLVRLGLVPALFWASAAAAVDQPSTYPGCATREVSVAWGGSVRVDLSACHSFGLGVVSKAPEHGTTSPGDADPVDGYTYQHAGAAPAGGGRDRFVVRDDNGDLITVNVTIAAGGSALVATPAELPALQAGTAIDLALGADGGRAPYRWRLAEGRLPEGLQLSADGRLSGTPTERGGFSFGLRLEDARGASALRSYGGVVQPGSLSLSPAGLTVEPGVVASQALTVTGGVPPYRFDLEPGATLPAGLAISGDGRISGRTDAAPGEHALTLRITDSSGGTGRHFELETFVLTVAGAPAVSIMAHPARVAEDAGQPLVFTVTRSRALPTATVVTLVPAGVRDAPTSLTIAPGATSARIIVRPRADTDPEPDETVAFAVAPGDGYSLGTPARARGVIGDDDSP